MENLSDTRDVGNVGLDSQGFPTDYDPKTVRGVPGTKGSSRQKKGDSPDRSGYGTRERDWKTQGEFDPDEETLEVFSQLMDSPIEELEEQEVVTDGGIPYDDSDNYKGDVPTTLGDLDHEGPYGRFEEGGAPW